MAFNLEWKATWDELSPSLQELFKHLQTQISDNRTEINDLDERVTQNEKDIDAVEKDIESIIDGDRDIYIDGDQGQVLKVNQKEKKVYPHDEFLKLRCVSTDEELAVEMKNIPISLKDVFNNWCRYAHYNRESAKHLEGYYNATDCPVYTEGQNLDLPPYKYFTDKSQNGWGYNASDQSIYTNGAHQFPITGFINTVDKYTNYYIRCRFNFVNDGDNGGIVIGYMVDSAGVEHTLSVIRGGKADATNYQWGLVYDAGNSTFFDILNLTSVVGHPGIDACCYVIVSRHDTSFECKMTAWNSDYNHPFDKSEIVKEATFTFSLPATKPAAWPQAMYDNIKVMLHKENRIGFMARSGDLRFRIDEQHSVFDDEDIYALHTDKVYTYDFINGKWAVKGNLHEILSNKIFIYYPRNKYFYFYNYWNNYTKLELDPNRDIIEQIQNQIKTINNNVTNLTNKVNNNYNELKTYVNNTINNSQTIVNNYADEKDFLNLAPKIGYFGEDTVQVIPKYNMNLPASNRIATTESNGQEVMYFAASDGGPTAIEKCYKAYRNTDSSGFTFDNEPLIPYYMRNVSDSYIIRPVSCDNEWLIANVRFNSRDVTHLIHTKYSSDPSDWTTYKDITNIFNHHGSTSGITVVYFKEHGTIAVFDFSNINSSYAFKLKVYRYSNLALLQDISLESFADVVRCDENYSFADPLIHGRVEWLKDQKGIRATTYGNAPYVYYNPIDQTIVYYAWYNYIARWNVNTHMYYTNYNHPLKIIYDCPLSVMQGKTNRVTRLTGIYTITSNGSAWPSVGNDCYATYTAVSYDSFNKTVYMGYYPRDAVYPNYLDKIKFADQTLRLKDNSINIHYGSQNCKRFNATPPDASMWGKCLYDSICIFSEFFMDCGAKTSQNVVHVKKWRYVSGHSAEKIIEPVPGQYNIISSNVEGEIMPNMYQNSTLDYSVKNTNGTVDYYYVSGRWIYKYTPTFNTDNGRIARLDPFFNMGDTFENGFDPNTFKGKPAAIICKYYNPLNTTGIFFLRYNTDDQSDPMYTWVVVKTYNYNTKAWKEFDDPSYYTGSFLNFNNNIRSGAINNRYTYNIYIFNCNIMSATKMNASMRAHISSGNEGGNSTSIYIDFNNNYTSATISNHNFYSAYWENCWRRMFQLNLIYNQKYGFVMMQNYWDASMTNLKISMQKPLFSSDGPAYTDDEFLLQSKSYTYRMRLQSAQGLIAYVPNIPIFLGGYFSVIENPVAVDLFPNCDNYIYLERDSNDRTKIIVYASKDKFMEEGVRQFNRIIIARIRTNEEAPLDIQYYRINTGYNDYSFH